MASIGDVSVAWEQNAGAWLDWARTPDHDVYYEQLNLPAFAEIVPSAGRRTLDVGCGEGRLGRRLAEQGHTVAGIDSSPTLAASARDAGGYDEVVCGDAASMPWPDGAFDGAVAFMTLHDMATMPAAVHEVGRVLEPGAVLAVAIVHPLNRSRELFEDYFAEHRFQDTVEHDGLRMTFHGIDRPLDAYTRALHDAGFVIEQLREPRPDAEAVRRFPRLAPAARRPFFLHLRCRRR